MTPAPPPQTKKSSSAVVIILVVLVGGLFLCMVIGILAAIAIPNFIRFQSRSKQMECKTLLKGALTAERTWKAEHDSYIADFQQLEFQPESTRSVLLFAPDAEPVGRGPDSAGLSAAIRAQVANLGVSGACPDCQITIGCALNVDKDPEIDVWSISTADRRNARGGTIPAGTPFNDFSDVTDEPGQ